MSSAAIFVWRLKGQVPKWKKKKKRVQSANSTDPDEVIYNEQSHLDLHFLSSSLTCEFIFC